MYETTTKVLTVGKISLIRYAVRQATRECRVEKRECSILHYVLFNVSYHA